MVTDNNGATLAALFLNAVSLAITIEERLSLEETQPSEQSIETNVVEQLLDVFFTLVAYKIRFIPLPYENIKTEVMKKVCQFVYIKAKEKENTLKTIEELEQIGDISCFGKHKLSYEAVLFYTKSLAGDYDALETWINQVEYQLDEHAKCEWFYNRIKLYQADCYMLNGKFQSAYSALVLLGNEYISMEDYYSIQRTIGHIQRFNFQLDEAEKTYNSLMRRYHNNPVFREYLVANLAETQCYFPDSNFIKRNKKILKSMVTPYNIKNKGKVLYALAIANTVKKHYHTARACIDECIKINCEDGYQSGELFAYIAQAYLDYALDGVVSTQTDNQIEHLLTCNKVYTFFRLQLALMRGDCSNVVKIGRTYDWLDYSQTERVCRLFLSQLRNA